jgi:hypothetical protein
VDASEAEREKAALEAAQRQAAVESLQAQHQELLVAVSKANQNVVAMMKVRVFGGAGEEEGRIEG